MTDTQQLHSNISIFQVSMALKPELSGAGVDLRQYHREFARARDFYNGIIPAERCMFLLELKRKEFYFIYMEKGNKKDYFASALVNEFTGFLAEQCGWQEQNSRDGGMFTVSFFMQTQGNHAADIIDEARKFDESGFFREMDARVIKHQLRKMSVGYSGKENDLVKARFMLEGLVGAAEVKKNIGEVITVFEGLMQKDVIFDPREVWPRHLLITAEEQGLGVTRALNILSRIFYYLRMVRSHVVEEVFLDDEGSFEDNLVRCLDEQYPGLIGTNGILALSGLSAAATSKKNILRFARYARDTGYRRVVAFVFDKNNRDEGERFGAAMAGQGIQLAHIHFPLFKPEEMKQLAVRKLESKGFGTESETGERVFKALEETLARGGKHNIHTVNSLVDEAVAGWYSG